MSVDFTPTLDGYTGQSKLRFWCQKVLPLVYDDSLSYYELLNKIVVYLNNTIEDVAACEDNITALRDAFVDLQNYVNEIVENLSPEIESVIDKMIDSGEFGEILTNVVNGLIANEYDPTEAYVQFAYCLKDGKLYCANASTTGEWDATKWRETTVGNDLQLLNRRLYNLNAGQVSYDNTSTYDEGTVGKELQNLNSSINTIENSIAYIINGKRLQGSTAVTTGQYVLLKNSTITGKTDGLYTATKTIPTNTDIDGTYLTAVSGGAINNAFTWERGTVQLTAGEGTLIEANTRLLYCRAMHIALFEFQVNGSDGNTELTLSIPSTSAIKPIYAYNQVANTAIKCTLENAIFKIWDASTLTRASVFYYIP